MRRMNQKERDSEIDKLYTKYISSCGLSNAMKIVYGAYKKLRAEKQRRKENAIL